MFDSFEMTRFLEVVTLSCKLVAIITAEKHNPNSSLA